VGGADTDWLAWHEAYADPESWLSVRLRVVQGIITDHLEQREGPVRVVSACAGEGRDLLGVLERRDDAARVSGRLVEADPVLAGRARDRATAGGFDLEVVHGDAGSTTSYAGAVPADLVLLCGVFGDPDVTPRIRAWFADAGLEEITWFAPDDDEIGVGAHRLVGDPVPLEPGHQLFRFV
jgi:hypothetical protein